MRWITVTLVALLVAVQADLWFGRSSLPHVMGLERQLAEQQEANRAARERNQRLVAEVSDLKEGLEMVEERARADLGFVRENEILVRVKTPRQ